ncbi:MAG: heme NO-binding domain-containing protein [Sneathiella sp.]
MKGVVFTEFLQMVDEVFSPEMTEMIIVDSDVESKGVYTTVGTYPHTEILALVVALHKRTGAEVSDLVHAFGKYLFISFTKHYPHFFENQSSAFEFLKGVDTYIHVEVNKLYPEANTPSVKAEEKGEGELEINYKSECPFAELANGLLEACIEHFQQDIKVERPFTGEDGCSAQFRLLQA